MIIQRMQKAAAGSICLNRPVNRFCEDMIYPGAVDAVDHLRIGLLITLGEILAGIL